MAGILAEPSTQPIYVDGQKVSMTAYSINGSNYVRLRDVGQAVNFGVAYDPVSNEQDRKYRNLVHILSGLVTSDPILLLSTHPLLGLIMIISRPNFWA